MLKENNSVQVNWIKPSPPVLLKGIDYRFHVMVKPMGSKCNMDCTYCFYLHKEQLLDQPKMPKMSDEVLSEHIRQYIEGQTGDEVIFTWQGGEPTLTGLDFFRRVVALQRKFAKSGQRIENDLQTNGLLLDNEWGGFLKQHNFLVGLSIDGPAEFHDKYRYTKGGHSTHAKVMSAVELLHKYEIPFSALCVVNRLNCDYPLEVYRFLRDEVRAQTIQFIPVIEPRDFTKVAPQKWLSTSLPKHDDPRLHPDHPDSVITDWSVPAGNWGPFLVAVWNEWLENDLGQTFIDNFENTIGQLAGFPAQKCTTSEFCGKALAIEYNGDVFSCDQYVYPQYKLGNIKDVHEGQLAFSEAQKTFGFHKRDSLPTYCRECNFLKICWGECPKNRFTATDTGENGLNYLCRDLKMFYLQVTKDLETVRTKIFCPNVS